MNNENITTPNETLAHDLLSVCKSQGVRGYAVAALYERLVLYNRVTSEELIISSICNALRLRRSFVCEVIKAMKSLGIAQRIKSDALKQLRAANAYYRKPVSNNIETAREENKRKRIDTFVRSIFERTNNVNSNRMN